MKYQYFVTSDVHSFYSPLKEELDNQGFDINNKRHKLIVCGDLFDRGEETLEVYNFIKSIPKNRRILIRGNHEYLLKECLEKKFPSDYDYHNGTVKTICAFANVEYNELIFLPFEKEEKKLRRWKQITSKPIFKKLIKWVFDSNEWVDYYEYKNYIFVHSFIPLNSIEKMSGFSKEYNPNWRIASREDFEAASWGCPFIQFAEGYFNEEIKNNKILVCGHWHCKDFHRYFEGVEDNWDIYKGKNLIALDKCTVLTKKTNVLVIE